VPPEFFGMTDAQFSAYVHVLAWHTGGSLDEPADGFIVGDADEDAGTVNVYWLAGKAIGSLTVRRPSQGTLGRLRSVDGCALCGRCRSST
jgi:hypothetical protein